LTPYQYIADRLTAEMIQGNMHACLRDLGRLAGGYVAAGDMPETDLVALQSLAEEKSINRAEAASKWAEAIAYGRSQPVQWDNPTQHRPDKVLDWDSVIGDDYKVVDTNWIESVEVAEPDIWDPVAQISTYLTTLFSSEEYVGYVTESFEKDDKQLPTRGNYGRTAGQLLEELARYKDIGAVFGDINPAVGAWIRFNPLDSEGVYDKNVTDLRFALVESDKLPIDQQRGIYEQLELPIAALVHSGNKSLHAIVRIDAADRAEYSQRVEFLYQVCDRNGLVIDRQNKNPSRLSRMPGVMRNGQKQFLVATNIGKKDWTEWRDWIEAVNDDMPDPESLATEWDRLPALALPLIDGVLRQGHKMLVSGPSKAGKSFLLIELCAAIAEGRAWLNWPCTQGRVLYVNLELDRASCLHRFRDVYQALGWPPNNLSNIDVWNLRGQAVPMDRLAPKLIRRAAKKRYSAVIIDPIYKVITGDENAADKMAHFCNQFDKVCFELKAAVIYCHHHSKGSQGGKRSMDRASGSGVFARDPDALLDLIELVVSRELRVQQENVAVCALVTGFLDQTSPGWRNQVSDDDRLSESKMRALAAKLLGEKRFDAELLPLVFPERKRIALQSAWRIEGTFREYPRAEPVNCWFDYPCHRIETVGVLKDADPDGMEPPWKKGKKAQQGSAASKKAARGVKVANAFNVIAENGTASIAAVAEYLGADKRTVRGWIEEGRWTIDKGRFWPEATEIEGEF
jgi:hypothetical protein